MASDASVMPSWQAERYAFMFSAIFLAARAPGFFSSTASSICDLRTRTRANSAMTKKAFIKRKKMTSRMLITVNIFVARLLNYDHAPLF